MPYDTGETAKQTKAAPRGAGLWLVPLLLVLAWVLYELTAQPALAVAAICMKFGWEDFRTACWLRRTDPERRRARACFWLYLASGLWKVAITASVMIFAYIFLKVMGVIGGRPARLQMIGAVLTAFGAIVFAALAVCWAIARAMLGRFKLWLNPATHFARRRKLWPPPDHHATSANLAGMLVGTSFFAALVPVLLLVLLAVVVNNLGPLNADPSAGLLLALGFPALTAFLILALFLLVRCLLAPRFFARLPSECWGPAAPVPLPQTPAAKVKEKPVMYIGDEVEASRKGASWRKEVV